MNEIKVRASGTTFAEISKANFRPIPVIVPSSKILQCFDSVVAPLYSQIVQKVRESNTLTKLRST